MAIPRSRVLDLMKVHNAASPPPLLATPTNPVLHQVQCRIFNTTFNPTAERLGNKVLRQRLRGPALAAYYPRRVATFKDFKSLYPGFETFDDFEEDRLEHLQIAKSRGKGAPKKKKSAAGELCCGYRKQGRGRLTMVRREQEECQEAEVVVQRRALHDWRFGLENMRCSGVRYACTELIPRLRAWAHALNRLCMSTNPFYLRISQAVLQHHPFFDRFATSLTG